MTDKEMCTIFAKNLANIMSDKGIKQADIVRELHVGKATVSGWCAGLNIPRTDALSKLTQMLDVNLSDLLTNKKSTPVSEGGPLYPSNYDKLTDANKAIVNRLIADLAKNQSKH